MEPPVHERRAGRGAPARGRSVQLHRPRRAIARSCAGGIEPRSEGTGRPLLLATELHGRTRHLPGRQPRAAPARLAPCTCTSPPTASNPGADGTHPPP